MATRYAVSIIGNCVWNTSTSYWSTASGGSGGASVPTSNDTVILDANSGSGTLLVSAADVSCASINCTGFTGTLKWQNGCYIQVYGSAGVVLSTTMSTYILDGGGFRFMAGSGTQDLNSAGRSCPTIYCTSATVVTLLADLLCSSLNVSTHFNPNGYNVTVTFNGTGFSRITVGTTYSYTNFTVNLLSNASENDISGNLTCTGTFTLTGASRTYLSFFSGYSSVRTITAANAVITNVILKDITGAGTASWDFSAQSDVGDAGGNTGITFPAPVTCYWKHGGTASVAYATANWYTTSGGSTSTRLPLPQDSIVFDANSFSATGKTVSFTSPLTIYFTNITTTGVTNSPTFTLANTITLFGNLTLGCNFGNSTYGVSFVGASASTITGSYTNGNITINKNAGVSCTLANNFVCSTLTVIQGTFVDSAYTITCTSFSASGASTRALNKTGNWIITGNTATLFDITTATGLSITNCSGDVKFTGTLTADRTVALNNITYSGTVWNATSGAYALKYTGAATLTTFKSDAGRINKFTAGTTLTATNWTISGSAGSNVTLTSITSAQHTLAKAGGGTVDCDYVTVSYSIGSPTSTFNAGANSINNGNNTNWTFPVTNSGNLFFGSNF